MINKEETIYSIELKDVDTYSGSISNYIEISQDSGGRIKIIESDRLFNKWRRKKELLSILDQIIFELEHNFKGEEEVESMAKSKDTKKETKKKPIKKSK